MINSEKYKMKSIDKIKNEATELEDTKLFCHTCLSRGRYLKKITDYEDICVLLFSSFELNKPIQQLLVCWECSTQLRKVVTFLDRARIAQNLLLVESTQHLNTLSTLSVKSCTKYDTIVYEYECTETINNKIVIKEEIIDDTKPSDDVTDEGRNLLDDHLCIKDDNDSDPDYDVKFDIEESKKERKAYQKVIKKYKGIRKDRYNIIKAIKMNDNYEIVKFDEKDLPYWIQKDKENHWYLNKKYKCEKCFIGFDNRNEIRCHIKSVHPKKVIKTSDNTCDICQAILSSNQSLSKHLSHHYEYYACKVCPFKCYSMKNMCQHFKYDHGRKTECAECGAVFQKHLDMLMHYRSHNTFICDYCGKKRSNKKILARHIAVNHSVAKCSICNYVFKNYTAYRNHMNLQHKKEQSESAYCVECDMKFDNMLRYRYHIRTSVKHRGKKKHQPAQCPDCGKTYSRKTFMMNHYRHVHLKQTNYYCQLCDKYFLTSHHLNQHKKFTHEGEKRPMDKICYICGRGFNTNRTLINHVRTHTGERPNSCPHCPAKFVQKYAMKTHIKSVHLKIRKSAS